MSFVSDRGANLVKGLRDYETLFCFLHRINNVLKRSFFQLSSQRKKSDLTNTTRPASASLLNDNENDDYHSTSSTDDEETFIPTIQMRKKKKNTDASSTIHDQMKLKLKDFPIEGQKIIKTIEQCKSLVRYVKKVRIRSRFENRVSRDSSLLTRNILHYGSLFRMAWTNKFNLLEVLLYNKQQSFDGFRWLPYLKVSWNHSR